MWWLSLACWLLGTNAYRRRKTIRVIRVINETTWVVSSVRGRTRHIGRPPRSHVIMAFIKVSMFRNDCMLGSGVTELLALVPIWMANKDTLFHVWVKHRKLILLHMHI